MDLSIEKFKDYVDDEFSLEQLEALADVINDRLVTLKTAMDKANYKPIKGFSIKEEAYIYESLRDWFKKEKWVRITTSGNIAGPCGTSKNKKNPDRCLPAAKARSLTKAQRAATARKKKKAGAKGQTVVKNTKKATVRKETKGAPPGHYFTASGNLVKGRLTKAAKEKGARLSDPKDKQRSKVPPVSQYNESLTVSGNSEEEIKKNAEELLALAKKVGLDKAEIKYYDNGNVFGVELNDKVEDRNADKTGKVRDLQTKQREAAKAARPKDNETGMHKPARLRKLTVGGKTYEIGDFDPNDDGRIMSIEKYPNGYYITGGVYTDYGDGDEPKEGYGYALSLDGKEMDEEDLEGMFENIKETADPQDGKAAPYGSGYKPVKELTKGDIKNLIVGTIAELKNENTIEEKDDRCTRIAKRKYDTWPSAYASGAVVRCRRGEIWKGQK